MVRLRESEVDVLVVGDLRSWFGIIKSSHRRSFNPVLNGSFPLDLRESEKDRPGDLRVEVWVGESPGPDLVTGMAGGGVVRAGTARGGVGCRWNEGPSSILSMLTVDW